MHSWTERFALMTVLAVCWLAPASTSAQDDPFAPKETPQATPAGVEPEAGVADQARQIIDAVQDLDPRCEHITGELCQKSNTGLLATAGGYVLVCVVLFTGIRIWWDRRGTSRGVIRFVVTCALAAGIAATLAGLDPFRGDTLQCCIDNPVFRAYVLLQDSSIGRAMLFGLLPTSVLLVLVMVGERLIGKG